ncbi:MAG: hypothetical protein KJP23_25225 [Deltaproteobacteria bacterium]|nr:hypothetical protein [Deltaproteobacteria bacterium]
MVFTLPQYWDVAIDGIQIIICFLILFFLIRSRRKPRQSARQAAFNQTSRYFNVEVFSQTIKQQVDQAFAVITETIAVEQRKLYAVLLNRVADNEAFVISEFQSSLHQQKKPATPAIFSESSSSDQLHEQIQKLAVKGLSARQISEKLKTPLGEVELVLSLRTNEGI